ncbi:MAG: hypothetical protein ACXVZV_12130, partial [Terriglobales bacterium]
STDELRALLQKNGIEFGARQAAGSSARANTAGPQGPAQSAAGQNGGGGQRYRAGKGGNAQPGGGEGTHSGGGGGPMDRAIVWKLTVDKQLLPVQIRTGITDHTVTEVAQVLKGQLAEGDELVTGSTGKKGSNGPGMMGGGRPPGR